MQAGKAQQPSYVSSLGAGRYWVAHQTRLLSNRHIEALRTADGPDQAEKKA